MANGIDRLAGTPVAAPVTPVARNPAAPAPASPAQAAAPGPQDHFTPAELQKYKAIAQQANYSALDARKVATDLGSRSTNFGYAVIGKAVSQGENSAAVQALQQTHQVSSSPTDDLECLAAFESSNYSPSDVAKVKKELLANNHGFNAEKSREYIGLKILTGNESVLQQWGVQPKADFRKYHSAFLASAYSVSDAKQVLGNAELKSTYQLHDIDDAKALIGKLVLDKKTDILTSHGVTEYNFDAQECLASFHKYYTDADAVAAVEAFNFLRSTPQDLTDPSPEAIEGAREYIGLKVKNGPDFEKMLADVGIHRKTS